MSDEAEPQDKDGEEEPALFVNRGGERVRFRMGPPFQHADVYVASRIRGAIASGELKAGDKLPSEKIMGLALHVSRDPVGRGLEILKAEGRLTSRQGSGWFVT